MCKYCERHKTQENDHNPIVDLLADSPDFMACISEITPIAKRKHPDCTGELFVDLDSETVSIPIKYCPMCGRRL